MARYHINGKGEIKLCKAKANCPFIDVSLNSESLAEARLIVENKNKSLYGSMPKAIKKESNGAQAPKADNSKCEIFFTELVAENDGEKQFSKIAEIEALPDNKKPIFLRGCNGAELEKIRVNLINEITRTLNGKDIKLIKASPNNRVGSDLIEVTTGTSIEVKLGGATDANLGFPTVVDGILSGVEGVNTNVQKSFYTAAQRTDWKQRYHNDNNSFNTIQEEQGVILSALVKKLNGGILRSL